MCGFPAHAGMDLHARIALGVTCCGGFPAHAGMDLIELRIASRNRSTLVSPPTRGWTLVDTVYRLRALRRGFPAHAGMDRP